MGGLHTDLFYLYEFTRENFRAFQSFTAKSKSVRVPTASKFYCKIQICKSSHSFKVLLQNPNL
ncbi:hypothetical protein LEP1GSC126_3519 [Leptospira kirschneri str. 200801774]|nr:hypothetical protein LEP1GSC126_3519 [Leptospira kirschneri str. 200801774]